MGLAALLADGDLFEPIVAMETEQEGYDHKTVKLFIHTYSDIYTYIAHYVYVHVECLAHKH